MPVKKEIILLCKSYTKLQSSSKSFDDYKAQNIMFAKNLDRYTVCS